MAASGAIFQSSLVPSPGWLVELFGGCARQILLDDPPSLAAVRPHLSRFYCGRLFERALETVATDYLAHQLWDKYIEFEVSQEEFGLVAKLYASCLAPSQALALPSQIQRSTDEI